MTTDIDAIALRLAEETDAWFIGPLGLLKINRESYGWVGEFARRLVAELTKGQEPIYRTNGSVLISAGKTQVSFAGQEWIDLYAAPPLPPVGWKLVPVEPTDAMNEAREKAEYDSQIWDEMLAAAPEYKP